MDPSRDPSILNEPHYTSQQGRGGVEPDPTDSLGIPVEAMSEEQEAQANVWDEPGFSPALGGPVPDGAVTYASHLAKMQAQVTVTGSWSYTLMLALAAGPWAVVMALAQGITSIDPGILNVLGVVILTPVVEETVKVALAAWAVEVRPWKFVSRLQILAFGVAAGLFFGLIENLIYFFVYLDNPSNFLVMWRLLIVMPLHGVWSLIAAAGLAVAWQNGMIQQRKPRLEDAFRYSLLAMVFHGSYNALAIMLQTTGMFD